MTLDWLDFSVEHLSDWIDAIDVFAVDDNLPFHVAISKLHKYTSSISEMDQNVNLTSNDMKDTIAVIAFEPLESRAKPEFAVKLSAST